jgi:hypothetical protein
MDETDQRVASLFTKKNRSDIYHNTIRSHPAWESSCVWYCKRMYPLHEMIEIVSVRKPKQKRIIGFQNIIGFFLLTLWVLLLLRLWRHWRDRKWRHEKWRHKTESWWFPLGVILFVRGVVLYSQGVFYHVLLLTVVFLLNNLKAADWEVYATGAADRWIYTAKNELLVFKI